MYKALYDFTIDDENGLSFTLNERFTVLDSKKDPHWWLVQNGTGKIGFVPANYLAEDDSTFAEVLSSIDRGIATLKYQVKCAGGEYTAQQKGTLQKLEKHRQKVLEEQKETKTPLKLSIEPQHTSQSSSDVSQHTKGASGPPMISPHRSSVSSPGFEVVSPTANGSNRLQVSPKCKRKAPLPPSDAAHTTSDSAIGGAESKGAVLRKRSSSSSSSSSFRPELGSELVELVRRQTNLSHDLSYAAAATVITHIRDNLPSIAPQLTEVLQNLYKSKRGVSVELTGSHDAMRLKEILRQLTEAKNDEQQRSWHLHEDEDALNTLLRDMYSILDNADPSVCKEVLKQDDYNIIQNLVLYYQMETRVGLRLSLLRVFGALCQLQKELISMLLGTVLPIELARDILDTIKHEASGGDSDLQKLRDSLLLFSMLFCTGEKPPLQCYNSLNAEFLSALLDSVELPLDDMDDLSDNSLNALLAFNLHFDMPEENPLMKLLASKGCTEKTLTEKLMLLLNRDADPINRFEHEPKPPNSIQKFFTDIYSQPSTSTLLYTNDEKVLVDIMLQRIVDGSPGDQLRTEYLSLMHLFLTNSSYHEYRIYQSELNGALNRIWREDSDDTNDMDKRILKQIWDDFPDMFWQKT